jgi:hypothetical protein
MKINFKSWVLFLTLGLTAFVLQTACVNEAERLAFEKKCQTLQNEEYFFGFDDFLDAKKVILREMANGKVLQEKLIDSSEKSPYGFRAYLPVMDSMNKSYYQIVIDDKYLFTLSEIKIYAREGKLRGRYAFYCVIKEFKVNGKIKKNKDRGIYKKDAVILPVTTP